MIRPVSLLIVLLPSLLSAQMVTGQGMKEFASTFRVSLEDREPAYAVYPLASAPGGILFPHEMATLRIQLQGRARGYSGPAAIEIVPYGTRGLPGDIWTPEVVPMGQPVRVPFTATLAKDGYQDVEVRLPVPERMGAYAVVADLGEAGRRFVTSVVRTYRPNPTRLQYPKFSLDTLPDDVLSRLGVQSVRKGVSWWRADDPESQKRWNDLDAEMARLRQHQITVMLMVMSSPVPQPLDRDRPHLDENGVMLATKTDMGWLPQYDPEFRKWTAEACRRYGWPKGQLTAMNLWNEPWEGLSISGWGADMLRYREMYRAMAQGVFDARKQGSQVLLAAADSSSNTLDKFFSDGSDEFLPMLDACTIHYQGLSSPAVLKLFRDRKGPEGRVKIWDTESWVANTDDRVATVVATNRASGYDRSMGIFGGNISGEAQSEEVFVAPGKKERRELAVTAWSTAAAVGAMQHLLGERPFERLLFPEGLPWVMVFGGLKGADDGVVVVTGDIGESFGRNNALYRGAPLAKGATLTLPASADYSLFDFYGNPVSGTGSKVVVPLDHRGFFLRPSGKAGSRARLLDALQKARVAGVGPVEIVAKDWTGNGPLRVELRNVLNRPLRGQLSLDSGFSQEVILAAFERKTVEAAVKMEGRADNQYPVTFTFDAGTDGKTVHLETMRRNVIARRTPTVDGDLKDWEGVLPQGVKAKGTGERSLTEAAWFPFQPFAPGTPGGFATGYTAYDDENFYFAAKVADSTPHPGTARFATRDDDAYFYPPVSYEADVEETSKAVLVQGERVPDDERALAKPGGGRSRAYWESAPISRAVSFDLDLSERTRVNLALAPYDNHEGMGVIVTAKNRETGEQVSAQGVERLWSGAYVPLDLQGKVRVTVRSRGWWYTPKLAGVFLDAPEGEAKVDYDTKGQWEGKYGKSGYRLADGAGEAVLTLVDEVKLKEHRWPEGVRRFSYRKWPDLPAGNGEPGYDNVQIGFNVLPEDQKPTVMALPGLPPKFTHYADTDYEFALNAVRPEFGGGTEIWRLQVPGMSRQHFYPHQPRPKQWGPAKGQLVVRHEGGTRVVECAIPWSEIPEVREAMRAGRPIKFSFLVNDSGGTGGMELAAGRSVSKLNSYTFHVDWAEHWANEVEFGWGR